VTPVGWPEGRRFAFTVFDDPDGQTLEAGREIYALLADLGFRTTKGVWPLAADLPPGWGGSCEDAAYREWCVRLQTDGFEIGYHNARQTTSPRENTERALDRFFEVFGHYPVTMSNHYNCDEDIYWGEYRLTGIYRRVYNLATRGKYHAKYFGHVPEHPYFWGDLCKSRIRYVRNFVFRHVDTLAMCPGMPYHDPQRPFVNRWYASSEGANVRSFTETVSERNQDLLMERGGGCIMYAHFGHGFVDGGKLDRGFVALMTRLAGSEGWFVPVGTLLDYLESSKGPTTLSDDRRADLERRWLWAKLRHGTS